LGYDHKIKKEIKPPAYNSVLLKFWGFSGLASLLALVQFPAVDSGVFVNPQISEALFVSGNYENQTPKKLNHLKYKISMSNLRRIILAFGLLMNLSSYGQKGYLDKLWNKLTDTTFINLVNNNRLIFTMPDGFVTTNVKRNDNVFYQYAIKDKNSNFEIRIFIKSFKQISNKKGDFDFNKFSYNFMSSTSLNASGNVLPDIPQIDLFPEDAVKKDFNADWGATTAFAPKTEFGKGFTFCAFNCIRLNDICEVNIFYMFDDVPNQQTLMEKSFLVMKFK
jgi:hypothetical protein